MLLAATGGVPFRAVGAEPGDQPAARGAPVISPGEKAQTTLFGIQAEGTKFVYVLDRSGSMGDPDGKPLAAAKAEILASLERLDSLQQFQVILYNEHPRIFSPTGERGRLTFGTEQNKAEVRRFLAGIGAEGGTDHEEALVAAIRMQPDVVFLMTDGDDPKLTARQLARIDRLGPGIIIHTVEFGVGRQRQAEGFMEKLARQSGGEHVYVDSATGRVAGKER